MYNFWGKPQKKEDYTGHVLFESQDDSYINAESGFIEPGMGREDQVETQEAIFPKRLKILETETGWLNVRSEPSLISDVSAKVYSGEEFTYIEEQEGPALDGGKANWYKIIFEDDDLGTHPVPEGWVFGEYIEILIDNE